MLRFVNNLDTSKAELYSININNIHNHKKLGLGYLTCSELFSSRVHFRERGAKYFHQGQKFKSAHPKTILPLGHKRQEGEGAEYLIVTIGRLVLATAPYAEIRAFFIRGRNILFWILFGAYIEGGLPFWFDLTGEYAPYPHRSTRASVKDKSTPAYKLNLSTCL